ncbi:1,2-phenylacetyl-CoA epoxidase subunit PaaD [Natrononativus amylolyticus]|uniref:1,2-phenylacetyl-CoA epoxidase subunit PaaD n=1 Tax=Natrononativus amylolyticus TaxID=2963434 RepID=UPI0020CBEADE|nr:1,2-phenylacetyl-CoA epoxidase subunit PaaD [Natrononativus amylolyticus]
MGSNHADRHDVEIDFDAEQTPCAYTRYVEGEDVEALPATGEGARGLEAEVWDALYAVEDPEMPVSIVDLGLIYGVELSRSDDGIHATVIMTLTYTGCPARKMLTDDVREAAASPEGVDSAEVDLVWSPEWSLEMVTEQGKDDLREFGLSV